ncbi:unnamed protein product [Orchesella dallaii]|uniref:EGF-like domain-containing protein n=1 Tax=Orchesella dallaii TaxID=48710 RepID=A0ABP1R1E8_9HEXA
MKTSLHVMRSDGVNWKTLTTKQALTPMDLSVFSEQTHPNPVWGSRNPCLSSGCSHLCLLHSSPPYYKCACPIGIKLLPNSTSQCSPQITNFLIVARGSDIRRISLDTEDFTDVTIPLSGIKHVLAVDYHVESGYLFWTDDEATRIKKAKLDGSSQQIVIKDEIIHPDGLVVDWVAQNLYWTDAGTDRIEVSRLDGTFRKILVSRGLQEPRAISVDPAKGFLFWSDWGKKAKIERSLLDGSERAQVVNEDIYWPNGIALDLQLEKIYWSDAKADRIEVCGYDGSGRRTVLQDDLPHIFGIALLGEHIYWTDWQRRSLERADKRTGQNRKTIKEPFTDPMGIKGVNVEEGRMWNVSNPCKGSNGGCKHLCFYKPGPDAKEQYICACSSGYELSSDGKSCSIPDAFLVFSRDGDLHRISLNRTAASRSGGGDSAAGSIDDVIPVSKVKAASALDFDTVESRIYWSDTKIKAIFRAFMNGSETEKVIEFGVAHPEGIAVDWLSRNIYWTDLERNRIEVAKLNGEHRRTVLWTEVDSPKSIVLHPAKGWMYYALWRTQNPTIEKAALDGGKRQLFVGRVGRANGLTIDLEESFLYWTDIDQMIIERCSLDDPLRTRQIIQPARNGFKPFSLAQYQEYIYWSDMSSQTIQRAHKQSVNVFEGTTEKPQKLADALNIIDMAIYHKLKQVGWNPCAVSNCSHLCFSVPSGGGSGGGGNSGSGGKDRASGTVAQCGCPTHYTLSPDGTSCQPPREYLLFSSGATISRLILDTPDCRDAVVMGGQSQKQRGISAIAWDGHLRNIYWIDAKTQEIRKAGEHGEGAQSLFHYLDEVFKAYDLLFDPVRQTLFWTCENYNSINVTDPSGKNLGSILSGSGNVGGDDNDDGGGDTRPRLLALHPYTSYLYFTNEGGRIERVKVDGMHRQIIVQGGHSIAGLAVDFIEGFLYWSDGGSRRIEMSDLDGRNRKVLIGGLDQPSSISVMGRFVYWIEDRGGVERVNKYTGDERKTALPRMERANYIVFINDSNIIADNHNSPYSNCDNRCSHICVDNECSCFEGFVISMEDRRTCGFRLPCGPHEFACSRGKIGCIPHQHKCNGKAECADGSDEIDCQEECDFRCPCEGGCFKPTCLRKQEVCDGKPDCPGSGYDESELACQQKADKNGINSYDEKGYSAHTSPLTTVLMPILIILGVILGAVTWYCVRTRQNHTPFSEECTDPLNAPGTTMTTVNTADTLHQFASNGSSSIGSSPYCELLVPHPSPATEVRSFCCHGNYAMYYKSVEPAPPPTPCSTDVCDNSDIYAFAPPPSPHTSSPHSTIRSYPPYPPPPSPDLA